MFIVTIVLQHWAMTNRESEKRRKDNEKRWRRG